MRKKELEVTAMEDNIITAPAEQPVSPDNPRKAVKRDANFAGGMLLIYLVIFMGFELVDMIFRIIMTMVREGPVTDIEALTNDLMDYYLTHAGPLIVGVAFGLVFMFFVFRKKVRLRDMMPHNGKKMQPVRLFQLLCIFMGCQLVFTYIAKLVELLLNKIGYSAAMGTEAAQAGTSTLSMFLYAGFIGPIAEELVFRGFVMRSLEKHGKLVAIVFSSVFFGLMHTNLVQTIFAAYIGLILGYVAMEYGIIWSMLLHILNNFLFGDMLVKIEGAMPERIATFMDTAIFASFTILGIYFIYRNFDTIKIYIKENHVQKKVIRWTFTAVCPLIFIIITVLLTISIIQPL